jgi:hypothetical protein
MPGTVKEQITRIFIFVKSSTPYNTKDNSDNRNH